MEKLVQTVVTAWKTAKRKKKIEENKTLILVLAIAAAVLAVAGITFLVIKLVQNSRRAY